MKQENLNKENFWNQLNTDCPIIMKRFCKFIDEWKEQNEWKKMFNKKIKFHHIPVEMQTGIVIAFIMKITNQPADQLMNSKTFITKEFEHIEKKITNINVN